jgi:hypothetical protein
MLPSLFKYKYQVSNNMAKKDKNDSESWFSWEAVRHGAHAVGAGLKAAAPGLAVFGTAAGQPEFLAGSAAAAGAGARRVAKSCEPRMLGFIGAKL